MAETGKDASYKAPGKRPLGIRTPLEDIDAAERRVRKDREDHLDKRDLADEIYPLPKSPINRIEGYVDQSRRKKDTLITPLSGLKRK